MSDFIESRLPWLVHMKNPLHMILAGYEFANTTVSAKIARHNNKAKNNANLSEIMQYLRGIIGHGVVLEYSGINNKNKINIEISKEKSKEILLQKINRQNALLFATMGEVAKIMIKNPSGHTNISFEMLSEKQDEYIKRVNISHRSVEDSIYAYVTKYRNSESLLFDEMLRQKTYFEDMAESGQIAEALEGLDFLVDGGVRIYRNRLQTRNYGTKADEMDVRGGIDRLYEEIVSARDNILMKVDVPHLPW